MPTRRCANCGTLQEESARCWVCRRSATSCATCRNFRVAVAGALGFCGLDQRREPLAGAEVRGCWQAPIDAVAPAASDADPSAPHRLRPPSTDALEPRRPRLEFVPVGGPLERVPRVPIVAVEAPSPSPDRRRDPAAGFWSDAEA